MVILNLQCPCAVIKCLDMCIIVDSFVYIFSQDRKGNKNAQKRIKLCVKNVQRASTWRTGTTLQTAPPVSNVK